MQNSIYKIKYLLFLSWDWEAWCLTQPGGNTPHERNTAWNRGKKFFHCLGAPNNLIRLWLFHQCKRKSVKNAHHNIFPKISSSSSGRVVLDPAKSQHTADIADAAATGAGLKWLLMMKIKKFGVTVLKDALGGKRSGVYHYTGKYSHYLDVFAL
jgi:hypothetical protein